MAQTLSSATVRATAAVKSRFKLVFFVPPENRQAVQTAVFNAGAGRYLGPGNYTECAWVTLGMGQFRPGDTANPHIGKAGSVEEVEEYRVEILCHGDDVAQNAVDALKRAHPYEEPAYEVYKLEDF